MDSKANTPFYLDKALWVTVFVPICAILGSKLGLDLNAEQLVGIILPVVVYVVTHKWKSAAITINEIKADAAKEVANGPAPASAADALKDAAK